MQKVNKREVVEIRCDECEKLLGYVVQFLTVTTAEALIVMLCPKCVKHETE